MAGIVYSTEFCGVTLTAPATVYYIVPAGFVAVVKCMTLGWQTTAAGPAVTQVFAVASNSRLWIVNHPVAEFNSAVWTGYLVLPAGERIRAGTSAVGSAYFTASGYLLTLP